MPGGNTHIRRTRSVRTPVSRHRESCPAGNRATRVGTDAIGREKERPIPKNERWNLALSWVKSNRVLIRCIAGPYFRYMSCDRQDLNGEALLTAYQVLTLLDRQRKSLSHMNPYFRVAFRTRCISLASGLVVSEYEIDRIPAEDGLTGQQKELDKGKIREHLRILTNRQRQISEWILAQPTPVSTSTVGRRFGIGSRTVRAILSNAIRRIEEYGCESVRKGITTAA